MKIMQIYQAIDKLKLIQYGNDIVTNTKKNENKNQEMLERIGLALNIVSIILTAINISINLLQ